jgi:trehalose synthase
MEGGVGGALVKTVEECAEQVVRLVRDRKTGQELAARGRELVRERFLLTRMIADELRLYQSVLGVRRPRLTPAAMAGLADEERCLVCGRALDPAGALAVAHQGRNYYFHCIECQEQFQQDPDRFARGHPGEAA